MEEKGQILALMSSKGGIGKTHLAIGLSAALAKRDARVLLIDADLGNGIVCDRLGFYPRFNLVHFFQKEKALGDLIEETPHGFFLIGGERGDVDLANLRYFQKVKFLRSFMRMRRDFDFVLLDLASGISRQSLDFALLAGKTIVVTSPYDLMSAYGGVRGCFSRFRQIEKRLCERIEQYKPQRVFNPLILMNHVEDFHQARAAFEALESAVENRLNSPDRPFSVRMHYCGAVFHDPGLFKKSEAKRCPPSVVSAYSRVAFCVDSIAGGLTSPLPYGAMDGDNYLRYAIHLLRDHEGRLRRGLTQKVTGFYPVRIPFRHSERPVSSLEEKSVDRVSV